MFAGFARFPNQSPLLCSRSYLHVFASKVPKHGLKPIIHCANRSIPRRYRQYFKLTFKVFSNTSQIFEDPEKRASKRTSRLMYESFVQIFEELNKKSNMTANLMIA